MEEKTPLRSPFRRLAGSLSIYRGLDRSIYILFFARVINSLGFFVYPFLTMFLTERMGLSESRAGVIMTVAVISFVPGSIIGGKLADTTGRKMAMVLAQFLSALSFMMCGIFLFLGRPEIIPVFIIGAEVFMGIVHPTTQAMATDLSSPENRKASFSLLYLGHNLGFAAGVMVGGFLYNNYTNWLFWGDALTTGISLLLVLFLVKESKPDQDTIDKAFDAEDMERAEKGSVFKALLRRPLLLLFVLIVTLFNFIYAQIQFSLPLYMGELFGEAGPVRFGSLMSLNAVVVILFTTPLIAWTKSIKPVLTVALASLFYAVGFGLFAFEQSYLPFLAGCVILTWGEILGATNINVYIANHTPITHRGRFNAIFPIIMGTGFALNPYIMGRFIENHGAAKVWPLCFILGVFCALLLTLLYLREKRVRVGLGRGTHEG